MSNDLVEATAQPVALADLVDRARALIAAGGRHVLGITGTPGAGKSTLCAALLAALGDDVALVGMDAFHLANSELLRLGRRDRKGSPDTFDVDGYVVLLQRLRSQQHGAVYAPEFDRSVEESIAGSVRIAPDVPLVITEGNYLLLDQPGWADVRGQLDEVWFLDVDPATRVERLNRRRRSFGYPAGEAAAWVRDVDERNAQLVDAGRSRADLIAHLTTAISVTGIAVTGIVDAGTAAASHQQQEVQA